MNKIISKIWSGAKAAYEKEWVKILFTFSFIFSCFAIVYFFTDKLIGLDDPLFHIRFAEILREKGFGAFKDFHWLYFSKISQDQTYFIYYNFLFYLALIPFTFVKSLIVGIKLYGIVSFSLAFTILYYFLLKLNIKKPFYWIIIFFALVNYGSVERFLVARPYTLAPALLILELYFLHKKKYFGVFFLSLIYVFWHTATFFFPLIVSAVFCVFENFYGRKADLKLIFWSFLGTIISVGGIVLFTPGFFIYMKDIIFGNVYNTAISKEISIKEGMELYPVNFFDYVASNIQTMTLFITAVVFEIYQYIQVRIKNKSFPQNYIAGDLQSLKSSLFFLSLLFFAGNFFTQRNGDFYVFFSAAYIAVSFDYILNYIDFKDKGVKISLSAASFIVLGYLFAGNMLFIVNHMAQGGSVEALKGASEWLRNNTDKKEIIFNPTWGWFTQLFYYNPDNYYITGIEPKFLYDYDSKLYWTWQNIADYGYICSEEKCDDLNKKYYSTGSVSDEEKKKWRQEESGRVADYIKNVFHSRFVITSNDFVIFNLAMNSSSRFEKVYSDSVYGVFVYKIN